MNLLYISYPCGDGVAHAMYNVQNKHAIILVLHMYELYSDDIKEVLGILSGWILAGRYCPGGY